MKRVILDKNIQKINIDARGSRPKFWFYFKDNPDEKWLFKNINRSNKSCNQTKTYEDIGEVVFSRICKKLKVDCVEYKLATALNEEEKIEGVICKNYNSDNSVEMSGYTLLESYRRYIYDNYQGLQIPAENTLENYKLSLENLNFVQTENKKHKNAQSFSLNPEKIYRQLSRMLILDYLCCQSDRNWYNISFLIDDKTKTLEMAPLFDNGNIFSWNFRKAVIEQQYKVLKRESAYSRYIELYNSKSMAMGIKTPVSHRNIDKQIQSNNVKIKDLPVGLFENELAEIIANDKMLSAFLDECGQIPLFIEEAFEDIADEEYTLLKDQSKMLAKVKFEHLQSLVNKKISEKEEDNEYNI